MKLSRVLLVTNPDKPDAARVAAEIAAWCKARKMDCADLPAPTPQARGALVCSLGGDGTLLRAASLVADFGTPILGVNVGSLGFLSQTSLDRLVAALDEVADGEPAIEERMRLEFSGVGIRGTALNDVVFRGTTSRLVEIRLSRQQEPSLVFSGDGLVLATPTGATAYSLSLGGPIVVPTAECIVATPHAAHVLGLRPVVFSRDDELGVSASRDLELVADGDASGRLPAGASVTVRRADQRTRLVRPSGDPGFFSTLAAKLHWSGVPGASSTP